jgi:hypothetical protein
MFNQITLKKEKIRERKYPAPARLKGGGGKCFERKRFKTRAGNRHEDYAL